ncbi:MAG: hypothetical protein HQK53_04130 [Oligoflexia bacterium]|nr:hypothetical protein [Oligoflexia bacterium]
MKKFFQNLFAVFVLSFTSLSSPNICCAITTKSSSTNKVELGPTKRIHDYETTRLKSTGGTGVASILMDEASVLNPASISFFNISAIYLQKNSAEFVDDNRFSHDEINRPIDKSNTYSVILSDAKEFMKGSISYQKQREWHNERKRYSFSLASPMGKLSSLGVILRYSKDYFSENGETSIEKKYTQLIFGATHALENGLTFGIVAVDPLEKKVEDRKIIIGTQYTISNILTIMADIGSDYREDLSDNVLYRGAIQINLFSDFYLRTGLFRDRCLKEKGTGIGLGWISPRLMLEVAIKSTEFMYSLNAERSAGRYYPKDMKDLSFSLSLRF